MIHIRDNMAEPLEVVAEEDYKGLTILVYSMPLTATETEYAWEIDGEGNFEPGYRDKAIATRDAEYFINKLKEQKE